MSSRRPAGWSRRRFLGTSGAAAALALVPGRIRRAAAATPGALPFPTIFIQLRGGWDPAYHFAARTGLVNRDVTSAGIRETAAGVRWYQPTMAAMTPHMEEAAIIRNVRMSPNINHHTGPVELWFGEADDPKARHPWTNVLASSLLAQAPAPAPNVTTYWIRDYDSSDRNTNYVAYHNTSPDPLGAAQRILDIRGFTDNLALPPASGLPALDQQRSIYDLVARMDARLYRPAVQPATVARFGQANAQADTLMLGTPVDPLWPPDDATRTLFDLGDDDLVATGAQGTPAMKTMLGLAFQLVRHRASHVVSLTNTGGTDVGSNEYDSHGGGAIANVKQRAVGTRMFDRIARLLTALKATPSPLDPTVSMFETTHVVIASEMGRSWNAENGTGTFHWDSTHVACFGGRFKRGYGFGDLDSKLNAIPADFTTGALNQGAVPSWLNVVATILKAGGVDPATYSSAKAIDAILRP